MKELAAHCRELFVPNLYFEFIFNSLAIFAIVAAIVLLIKQANIEFDKLREKPSKEDDDVGTLSSSAVEFINALPNLINALAKAPAPIVLVSVALLLIAVPNPEPGETCAAALKAEKSDRSGGT